MSSEKVEDEKGSDDKSNPQESKTNIEEKVNDPKDNKCQAKGKTDNTFDDLSSLVKNISLGDNQKDINTENYENKEINIVSIPDWLKDCESTFSWHLEQERGLGADLIILRSLEKLDELLIEEPEFSLQRFVSLLKLVLEYYLIGDIHKCCENLKIVEGCLEEEMLRNDPLYNKVKLSLGHVVSATKAQVLYIIGNEEESRKIGKCIIPVKILGAADKASLFAMKARFFLYCGYENGEETGVNYAQQARDLEPENPEWEYLLAKMLRQKRRDVPFSSEVPRDELKLLESAVQKDKNPKYLVYLAQVYRECATQAFRQYRNHPKFNELQSSINLMTTKSLEYYKEALALNPDSPGVLRRVGYGIMNLHKKFADYNLALECLTKSLEISENQMTLHVLGTFYLRHGNDLRKALEYFERTAKTGSNAGLCDMIRVKWMLDHEYDPNPDFEIGLSWKLKKKLHTQLLTQQGGYYLFIKRDFYKAIDYFKQIIHEDRDSPHMTSFKSFFLRMHEPINLYEYLANEALLLVQKNDSNSTLEPETSDEEEMTNKTANLGYVEDFLDLISEVHPELMEKTPDAQLVTKLIQASREIEANFHRSNRSSNEFRGHRGRGHYSPRNRGARRGGYYDRGNDRRGRFSNNQREDGSYGGERREGFSANQREDSPDRRERRGRFSTNQREDGPDRGERRGQFSTNQREDGPDGVDRRGRFLANQREGGPGGRFFRGRGQNANRRQKPRNDESGETSKKDYENWRRK